MKIDVVTLFPEFFVSPLATSMMAKAIDRHLLAVETHDPRDCATDKHRTVDGEPYGGGGGMVIKPEPTTNSGESESCLRVIAFIWRPTVGPLTKH